MIPAEVIKKKRNKLELSEAEIRFMVEGYTADQIPDYQMSALLMAIVLNGMNESETAILTQVMIDSGDQLSFDLEKPAVDKHSTGGVGDKTSMILAPIVAACGVPVPMMAGRGLGHTGGTIDKLESIPGFNTAIPVEKFKQLVSEVGFSIIGQTSEICPADKKIYGLRDVTATVESLPLICASIMSKKIAEGIGGLVLDVKCGTGAFMKTLDDAQKLARGLISVGESHGLQVRALVTNMNQPLGAFIGNAVEIAECLAILQNQSVLGAEPKEFADCRELSLRLAANMLQVADFSLSDDEARGQAEKALTSGRAFECFAKMVTAQGGDLDKLELPQDSLPMASPHSGYITSFDSEKIGLAGIELGAGRVKMSDSIEPLAGIRVHKKIGDRIAEGETIFSIFLGPDEKGVEQVPLMLQSSYNVSEAMPPKQPLIYGSLKS